MVVLGVQENQVVRGSANKIGRVIEDRVIKILRKRAQLAVADT
jgi:hypothetical protein